MDSLNGLAEAPSLARIATLESLREHLQWAIELEHFTLPPYLCALYSLDAARNREASEVVASVLVEEMLHMTLAANLLNAVGGRPRLDTPQMLPPYPRPLPHGDRSFEVPLLPFGPEALDVFLRIEQPAAPCRPPESDGYETIGQFYHAIRDGLLDLWVDIGAPRGFATTRLARSPTRRSRAEAVSSRSPASPRRLRRSTRSWNKVRAPHTSRYGTETTTTFIPTVIRKAQEQFNDSYCAILRMLDQAFNGSPQTLKTAIGSMYRLKAQAQALMEMPTEDGMTTAGPTFEYVSLP